MSGEKPKKSPRQKRAEKEAQRKEWTQEEIDAAMAAAGGTPKSHEVPPRRGPGQPSKYPNLDLEKVEALARGGLTKYEIAEALGISETSRKEYQNRYPAFAAAIDRGRRRDITEIENALHRSAKGFTVVEDKVFYDNQVGKVVTQPTIKHYPPDTKAALAILQHEETGSWKPKSEVTVIDPIAERLQRARERAKRA
jgi:hypothetical protein